MKRLISFLILVLLPISAYTDNGLGGGRIGGGFPPVGWATQDQVIVRPRLIYTETNGFTNNNDGSITLNYASGDLVENTYFKLDCANETGFTVLQSDKWVICSTFTAAGINAAIDALGAEGGEVYLPEGTYVCTDATITIDFANTTLIGSGFGTILDWSAGQAATCIDTNDIDEVTIQNMKLLGKTGGGAVKNLIGNGDDSDNLTVQNCWLEDSDNMAIYSEGDYVKILNNHIVNTDTDGVVVGGNYFVISGNTFYDTGGQSIYLPNGDRSVITDNVIFSSGESAIELNNCDATVVDGNVIYATDTGFSDIYIRNDSNGVVVSNNILYGSGTSDGGIRLDNADDCVVADNYSEGHDIVGIRVDNDCKRTSLSGNVVADATPYTDNGVDSVFKVGGDINPTVDDTYDLGDGVTPLRWRNLYISNNIYATGDIVSTGSATSDVVDTQHIENSRNGAVTFRDNIALNSYYLSGDGDDEGIFVDSSGNVGIGTASPGVKLEVAGRTDLHNDIRIRGDGVTDNLGVIRINTNANSDILLDAKNDGTDMTILGANGNVGIGTTAPTVPLEVNGLIRGTTSLWYNEYHLGASQTSPGASGATAVELNGIFSWNLDAITEYLYYGADIHDDWDAATDVEIEVTGYLGEAETADDLIRMSILCNYGTDHDNANTFKTQTLTVDHDIDALNAQYSVHTIPFTFNFDEDGNVLEIGDILHLRVYLDDVTTAPVVTDFNVTFVTIKYKSAMIRIEVD